MHPLYWIVDAEATQEWGGEKALSTIPGTLAGEYMLRLTHIFKWLSIENLL